MGNAIRNNLSKKRRMIYSPQLRVGLNNKTQQVQNYGHFIAGLTLIGKGFKEICRGPGVS